LLTTSPAQSIPGEKNTAAANSDSAEITERANYIGQISMSISHILENKINISVKDARGIQIHVRSTAGLDCRSSRNACRDGTYPRRRVAIKRAESSTRAFNKRFRDSAGVIRRVI
jgi:hypothetical protein